MSVLVRRSFDYDSTGRGRTRILSPATMLAGRHGPAEDGASPRSGVPTVGDAGTERPAFVWHRPPEIA